VIKNRISQEEGVAKDKSRISRISRSKRVELESRSKRVELESRVRE
jgi:hypothetical protein